MHATMIGLDIAKTVFQVYGEDAARRPVLRKRLSRAALTGLFAKLPPTVVGIEACGTAHHWARTLTAMGHTVRLIPAAYVRPFVKRNKTDARDAEAICEAMQRPSMRQVPVKTVEQQAGRGLETARDLLVRQHTQLMNSVRGLLAELAIVAAQGRRGFAVLCTRTEAGDPAIHPVLLPALQTILEQWHGTGRAITELEARLVARAKADATMRRLMTVPGIGPLSAHAIVAAIGDGRQFSAARDFAAWVGLTPRQHESGNRRHSGRISRQGDQGGAPAADAGRQRGHAPSPGEAATGHRLAAWHPGPPTGQSRGGGTGRQDRPHRLGHAALGPFLSRRRRRRLSRDAGEPNPARSPQAATAQWSGPGSAHSDLSSRQAARRNAWKPIRVTHRGQRSTSDRIDRPDT